MSNTYIIFQISKADRKKVPEIISKRLAAVELTAPAPVSNPDFIDKIPTIASWMLEFEGDSFYPNREIGLDKFDTPVAIMPWKSNYGYWTDSNVLIADIIENFPSENISRETFTRSWKQFANENQ